MRCPGVDKFKNQCNVYLRPNEKFCWKHIVQERDDPPPVPTPIKIDTKRLEKLANDDQNVHTPEIQIPLIHAVNRLLSWGRGMKINDDLSLPTLIQSTIEPSEINLTAELAIEYINNIFQSNDETEIFGSNYKEICLFVWIRLNYRFQEDTEKLMLLRTRFFQEVSESIGQCLNGNIARLINVFSGVDSEMSIQLASITKEQFIELLLDKLDLLTPEMAMQRTYQLLLKAQIPEDEWGPWIDAVRERKGIELVPFWEQESK